MNDDTQREYICVVDPSPLSPLVPDNDRCRIKVLAVTPEVAAIKALSTKQPNTFIGGSCVVRVCLSGPAPKDIHDFLVRRIPNRQSWLMSRLG